MEDLVRMFVYLVLLLAFWGVVFLFLFYLLFCLLEDFSYIFVFILLLFLCWNI